MTSKKASQSQHCALVKNKPQLKAKTSKIKAKIYTVLQVHGMNFKIHLKMMILFSTKIIQIVIWKSYC